MASHAKKAQQLARQLFKTSLVNGLLSAERVGGVIEYIEKHRPASPVMILKAYRRLVANEVALNRALVEHAGPLADAALASIAAAMTRKYARPIAGTAQRNDALLAGIRVRVGDDVYESSVAAQLESLTASL